MSTREEKALDAIRTLIDGEYRKEINQLKRRIKKTTEQRDMWRESASRYKADKLELLRKLNERKSE